MSQATFLVGDVRQRMAELDDASFDLILCSPPFLALRSYLPPDHPDKDKEIGSESTPAEFLDVLLELTAEWGRLLAPHGSIAIELGDTYAGSGGAGGDYDENGLRAGQPRFRQGTPRWDGRPEGQIRTTTSDPTTTRNGGGPGWPLPKSLVCVPQLYQVALAYGINPLTGQPSPAGRWRVRNLKPWIRSNPPVGALGDKERPATSYVIVATRNTDRYFDLDAVRTTVNPNGTRPTQARVHGNDVNDHRDQLGPYDPAASAGAPPRDWYHTIDAILDAELAARASKPNGSGGAGGSGNFDDGIDARGYRKRLAEGTESSVGAQGVHLRRALERAGILTTLEALDISPRGYSGAHYAVWPPDLVRLLVEEMCPRRVCTTCGQPSRRRTEATYESLQLGAGDNAEFKASADYPGQQRQQNAQGMTHGRAAKHITTLGWSDCGHNTWRPGRILDPFAGTGTTLAVATGMARDATGIDIDERNAHLALERVGMFLEIHDRPPDRERSA